MRDCAARYGLKALSADLSDYHPGSIANLQTKTLAIFLLSTYGEGDPSDNTTEFWEWSRKLETTVLSTLRYAAFGLGNSNYKYYNRVVDVVDEALRNAGASQAISVGKADDALGATEEDFLDWKQRLFTYFQEHMGVEERELKYEPTINVVEDTSLEPQDLFNGEPSHVKTSTKANSGKEGSIAPLTVRNSRELFSKPGRNCLHMELDLSEHPTISYKTGDHIAVWPINPNEEVERLIRMLGQDAQRDIPISILALEAGTKVHVPTPTSVDALFRYYMDICAPLSRETVQALLQFSPNATARSFLTTISKDKDAYLEIVNRNHINLGRLLLLSLGGNDEDKAWAGIPLSFVIETLPRLQPRYYSISSSSVISPRHPSLTAVVSSTELIADPTKSVPGLTTNYMLALSQSMERQTSETVHPFGLTYPLDGPAGSLRGNRIHAHIRKSRFKLPVLGSCPIVMVAAGTGIAPFRAFIAERARLKMMGKPVGKMMLFFGCRSPDEDWIYREELQELQRVLVGTLTIVTAFSRFGEKKSYVQDKVGEHGAEILDLLESGGNLYICGRTNMAKDVGRVLSDAFMAGKNERDEAAKNWTEELKRKYKWQEDVWG